MSHRLTPEEFVVKVDAEGLEYAFTTYGLTEDDLDPDADPELYDAVKALVAGFKKIAPLIDDFEARAAEYSE